MKKLFTLLFFITTFLMLSAQSSKWTYGLNVQGGVSGERDKYENYWVDEQFGDRSNRAISKLQPSVGVGIWTVYQLANRWGIYTGLDYLQLNIYNRYENIVYTTEQTVSQYNFEEGGFYQHQLQLPLQLRFYFGKTSNKFRPFLLGGIQAQYLLKHTNFYNRHNGAAGFFEEELEIVETFDFGDVVSYFDFHRLQFGLVAGLGMRFNRFLFSIQNSWAASSYQTEYTQTNCGFPLGTGGCFGPWVTGVSTQLLQQSSLRVQYNIR